MDKTKTKLRCRLFGHKWRTRYNLVLCLDLPTCRRCGRVQVPVNYPVNYPVPLPADYPANGGNRAGMSDLAGRGTIIGEVLQWKGYSETLQTIVNQLQEQRDRCRDWSYTLRLEKRITELEREARQFRWVSVKRELPKPCCPVQGYSVEWEGDDYNKAGVRDCFRLDDGTWVSSDWNNTHDTYENGQGAPTHWRPVIWPAPRELAPEGLQIS